MAQTAGDTNIVVIGWGDTSSTISSVTDNKLNSYALAVGPTSGTGLRQSIYYAPSIAGGSTTVTVTFNKAAAYPDVRILEYSGLDPSAPLDKAVGAARNGNGGEQRQCEHDGSERTDLRSGHEWDKILRRGQWVHLADDQSVRQHRGRQDGERDGQLQRHGD